PMMFGDAVHQNSRWWKADLTCGDVLEFADDFDVQSPVGPHRYQWPHRQRLDREPVNDRHTGLNGRGEILQRPPHARCREHVTGCPHHFRRRLCPSTPGAGRHASLVADELPSTTLLD